jgi:hypothetical protein
MAHPELSARLNLPNNWNKIDKSNTPEAPSIAAMLL